MMQLSQYSDAQLAQLFSEGNEKALETLIYRHKDRIYTSIYMLVKDKYIAEDLFQDTFLKVIKTIKSGRYDEQGKFLPWAIRVAHNLCMDYFRKTQRNVTISLPDGQDISELIGGTAESASERIEKRQTHDSIRKMIELLPEEQREVIVLRIYGDLSFKEIATLTDVSINTSLGRMRYGLLNLRKMITCNQLVLR
jgi:RNA polymerase sigma factor (sigma-70 family)